MAENPMSGEGMGSSVLTSSGEEGYELDKKGIQNITLLEETNSFVLDMEPFYQLTDKDMSTNSRITRNLSRKWQGRSVGEMKTNSTATNEKDNPSSPRGGVSTLGKPNPMGTTEHHHQHHQITIVTGKIGSSSPTTAESRLVGRRSSFKRSWIIDPRRILLFFASLSSMGSILLIYFTLSMGKLSGEDSLKNW
ncbi:uncharacterized protein LOC124921990 isoform X2 [Impatiens glandulifera]|uniref:uncharacterized protein LOC124921990 isoform X2 n=1 Tax=Impatiens glandulifera TaxID=253017 RepID=UPI001FB143B6|nr:uncharacterized protein LOC124921990 isoform X2 [Impatiens glandulifera]